MELYYCQPSGINPPYIILDEFESRHIITTMRKKMGAEIDVTDGQGNLYHCKISNSSKKVELFVANHEFVPPPKNRLALAIGYIRPNRLEFVLEKGTELGVSDFYLTHTRYSNYKGNNKQKYEKYLRQAIKQSLHFYLPELHLINNVSTLIERTSDYHLRIVAIDPASPLLYDLLKTEAGSRGDTMLSIGPEGGFSPDEVAGMDKAGFRMVSLGAYRLRAETAAITGIAILSNCQ